jgi:hypothetical protein
MKNAIENFHVTFTINNRSVLLATVSLNAGKAKLRRVPVSQSLGYHIPPSNARDLELCALYLATEKAAVSAVCNGYLVAKA